MSVASSLKEISDELKQIQTRLGSTVTKAELKEELRAMEEKLTSVDTQLRSIRETAYSNNVTYEKRFTAQDGWQGAHEKLDRQIHESQQQEDVRQRNMITELSGKIDEAILALVNPNVPHSHESRIKFLEDWGQQIIGMKRTIWVLAGAITGGIGIVEVLLHKVFKG